MPDTAKDIKNGAYQIKYIAFGNGIGRLSNIDNTELNFEIEDGDEFKLSGWNKRIIDKVQLAGTKKISFMYELKNSLALASAMGVTDGSFEKVIEKSKSVGTFIMGLLDKADPTGAVVERTWDDIFITAQETEIQDGQWSKVNWIISMNGPGKINRESGN